LELWLGGAGDGQLDEGIALNFPSSVEVGIALFEKHQKYCVTKILSSDYAFDSDLVVSHSFNLLWIWTTSAILSHQAMNAQKRLKLGAQLLG
jgi:hypothetical protein